MTDVYLNIELMKQCKFCGEQIPDDAAVCPCCSEPQEKEVKVCPYCEELVDADAVRCPVCGEALPSADVSLIAKAEEQPAGISESQVPTDYVTQTSVEEEQPIASNEPSAYYEEANDKPSNRKKVIGIVVVCLAVIAVGAGCFFMGQNSSDNSENETSTEITDSSKMDGVINAEIISVDFSSDENESEETEHQSKDTDSDDVATDADKGRYVFASERLLTKDDIAGLSYSDLRIMRNEIFARHGYIFKTKDMQEYFNAQSWYIPRFSDVSDQLNEIEKKNVAFIKSYE